MRVREATIDDTPVMAEILAAVAPEGVLGTQPPVDVEDRARRLAEKVEGGPGGSWVLEEDGGRVVGHAGSDTPVEGVFDFGMVLLPEARGRGGGRMLLDAVIAHARAAGAHKVVLEVWPDNGRAVALYVRAGFEIEGVRRDHYRRRDGSLRSSIMMGLRL